MNNLVTITTNLQPAKLRYVEKDGKRWLVAPVTMITPGVLQGSQGPLLYTPSDVKNYCKDWDGVPLTNYHPKDPLTNRHMSATEDGVWDRQGIGHIRNPRVTKSGALAAEAWLDYDRTKTINTGILSALKTGKPIEISTGLYTTNIPSEGYDSKGRYYSHVATNWKPDHLAILLDSERGACSLEDGCGLGISTNQHQHRRRTMNRNCNKRNCNRPTQNQGDNLSTKAVDASRNALTAAQDDDNESSNDAIQSSESAHRASIRAAVNPSAENHQDAAVAHANAGRLHEAEDNNAATYWHGQAAELHGEAVNNYPAGRVQELSPVPQDPAIIHDDLEQFSDFLYGSGDAAGYDTTPKMRGMVGNSIQVSDRDALCLPPTLTDLLACNASSSGSSVGMSLNPAFRGTDYDELSTTERQGQYYAGIGDHAKAAKAFSRLAELHSDLSDVAGQSGNQRLSQFHREAGLRAQQAAASHVSSWIGSMEDTEDITGDDVETPSGEGWQQGQWWNGSLLTIPQVLENGRGSGTIVDNADIQAASQDDALLVQQIVDHSRSCDNPYYRSPTTKTNRRT